VQRPSHRTTLVALVGMVAATAAGSASGQGVLLPLGSNPDEGLTASRTLVAHTREGSVLHVYEAAFRWSGPDVGGFVWVVPVGDEASLASVDCAVFDELENLAAPRILVQHRGPADGCGCDEWDPQQAESSPIGSHVWPEDTLAGAASGPEGFATWEDLLARLAAMGVEAQSGLAAEVLGYYVANGYSFLFSEVDGHEAEGAVCLAVRYPSSTAYLLPMRSAAVAADGLVEILIYVLDEMRVEPPANGSPYPAVEIAPDAIRLADGGTTNYQTLFEDAVHVDAPPEVRRNFVVEFSGNVGPVGMIEPAHEWLTRLRTTLPGREIISDVPLEQVQEGAEVRRDRTILVASAGRAPGAETVLALTAFGICLVARGRRRRSPR